MGQSRWSGPPLRLSVSHTVRRFQSISTIGHHPQSLPHTGTDSLQELCLVLSGDRQETDGAGWTKPDTPETVLTVHRKQKLTTSTGKLGRKTIIWKVSAAKLSNLSNGSRFCANWR